MLRLCIVQREASISTTRPVRVNERIRVPEVRLIDEDGTHIGILRTRDALEMARERGLDLVEVQPNAVPPVCRLMDYGKYRYEESRRERESRKRQKAVVVKEVRLRPKIDDHDLATKGRQAYRFLQSGDKVKISVLFRGREIAHQDIGQGLLEQLAEQLSPVAVVDQPPHMEGRSMVMLLSPKTPAADRSEAAQPATDESAEAGQ
ncbi:MAG: translation initiation factor IF-3 [Sphaerobacter sp.]|nr:translation initiation factor IF-3 [Sphaerobacter sp.]